MSGDVVVMTYQSLNVAVQNSRFNASDFGVIVGDEIHRALGPTTRQSIGRVMDGKIAIGFSATTEYAPNKAVRDLMPTEIYRLELRDAVERGYLAPIRAIAIVTNDKLFASGVG